MFQNCLIGPNYFRTLRTSAACPSVCPSVPLSKLTQNFDIGFIRTRRMVLTVLELSNQNELTYATTNVINYPGVSVTSGGQSDQDSGRK